MGPFSPSLSSLAQLTKLLEPFNESPTLGVIPRLAGLKGCIHLVTTSREWVKRQLKHFTCSVLKSDPLVSELSQQTKEQIAI